MEDMKTLSLEELESVAGGRKDDTTVEVYCSAGCGLRWICSDKKEAFKKMSENHRRCPKCKNELRMMNVV